MVLDVPAMSPLAPDIDENGVDRTQIRAMLALAPAQRLQRLEGFLASVIEIRTLNGNPPAR
jgi:hypothetical protein